MAQKAADNLESWLRWLEGQANTDAIPATLRCREMLSRLNLEKFCPIITVGGTNGKGSTSHFLSAYAVAMGKKVGRFTSPHLLHYCERIAINGVSVAENEVLEAFNRIKAIQEEIYLGYFDYSFLASMLIFRQAEVDLVILEVGLGGRLDATNSLDTDCAILTTIDFDHMEILGHTRDLIACEKAGIFRKNKLAICGDENTPACVRNHAHEIGAIYFERGFDFDWDTMPLEEMPIPSFPLQNALTAWQALFCLDKEKTLELDQQIFFETLESLTIPGRMQKLQSDPEIIVDVAHNPESVRYLVRHLQKTATSGKVFAIFSALQDKEVNQMTALCIDLITDWYLIKLDHPRAASVETLVASMPDLAVHQYFESLDELMIALRKKMTQQDRLIVFGSFYVGNLFLNWYTKTRIFLDFI